MAYAMSGGNNAYGGPEYQSRSITSASQNANYSWNNNNSSVSNYDSGAYSNRYYSNDYNPWPLPKLTDGGSLPKPPPSWTTFYPTELNTNNDSNTRSTTSGSSDGGNWEDASYLLYDSHHTNNDNNTRSTTSGSGDGGNWEDASHLLYDSHQPSNNSASSRSHSQEEVCSICQDNMSGSDQLKWLSCSHRFHKPCIDEALRHDQKCPVCRHPVE
jgi:hypothetical protein